MKRIVSIALAVCLASSARAAAPEESTPRVRHISVPLVVGVVAFNNVTGKRLTDEEKRVDRGLAVARFLEETAASQHSLNTAFHIHFDVVRGNYYQILHWLRSGAIDAAVLSPFSYELVRREAGHLDDSEARPRATVSFPSAGRAGKTDGGEPMFRAIINGQAAADPGAVLDACVHRRQNCTFDFVSHLSTSGFIYPLSRIYGARDPNTMEFPQLLERTRFSLWHSDAPQPVSRDPQLQFTYANHVKPQQQGWQPLLPGETSFPSDVLVLNCATAHLHRVCGDVAALLQIHAKTLQKRAQKEENPAPTPVPSTATTAPRTSGYGTPAVFDETAWKPFADRVERVRRSALGKYWERWYVDENYDFTATEVVDLLRNDQVLDHRREASVVLPGGGVRGAYQARILDALYAKQLLNVIPVRGESEPPPIDATRLRVSSIIGTSGGALVGYLAAHRLKEGDTLTRHWLDRGKVRITPSEVFPWLSPLRFLSLLLALTLFGTIAAVTTAPQQQSGAPMGLTIAFALILLAAPALIWRLTLLDPNFRIFAIGNVYVVLLIILHALHSTMEQPMALPAAATRVVTRRARTAKIVGIIGIIASIALATSALRLLHGKAAETVLTGSPVTAVLSIVVATLSVILIALSRGSTFSAAAFRDYLKGWTTVLLFGVVAAAIIAVVFAAELATSLELTFEYWVTIIGASLAATAIVLLARLLVPILHEGICFWIQPLGARPFPYTRLQTLILGGFLAIGAWILFVAPALYSGDAGEATFRKEAEEAGPATTRFVAAITAPGTPLGERDALAAGDYYACEPKDLPKAADRFLGYPHEKFLGAVSASGSPFPIYPGRELSNEKGTALFIDGGFAHLVPVEGAVLLGARQVLIVGNAARRDIRTVRGDDRRRGNERIFSILLSDAMRTFNLLFDRSQLVDLRVRRDVLVATIAPTWEGPDPFLMDFRPKKIRELIASAETDLTSGRPGAVLSWGSPEPLESDDEL
ncbi:MAG: hypothetical protein JWO56_99 [Acidobacteria bacterium]|nr:hypothetical protein [Acidobacteriota bacterium]